MRRPVPAYVLTAFALFPTAAAAQSVLTIPPSQCVWRAGDNPAWAVPNLDESSWQPYSAWIPKPGQTHLWIRCRADLSSLRSVAHPALQVTAYAAYELYLNDQRIGAEGDLDTGNFSLDSIRSYPVAAATLASGPSTIAVRVTRRSLISNSSPLLHSLPPGVELCAGERSLLDALRAQSILQLVSRLAESMIGYGVVGVLAIMLLGLFVYDRSRLELLLLSVVCLSLVALRMDEFGVAARLNYSFSACLWILLLGNFGVTVAIVPFFFVLARRRVPLIFWILVAANLLSYIPGLFDVLLDAHQPSWLGLFNAQGMSPFGIAGHLSLCAPFVAFWPWSRIAPRQRLLAVLCMLWCAVDLLWYAVELSTFSLPGPSNPLAHWGVTLLEARAFITECVLAALLGLLFREQRQITQERALLAGEMQAASEIQRMIAPQLLDTAPGLHAEVAFHPVSEVGGDFYQALRRGDSTLIVIADVSGKGLRAAMTGTLAVGVLRTLASEGLRPAALLSALNRQAIDLHQEGFITCLCLLVSAGGEVKACNAGHLAPYLNGEEVAFDSGLPIGITPDAAYTEHSFQLAPGDRLTLLSDGVVEAQSRTGELFGFDRTRALSMKSAEEIASAALDFGQQDDITVLTLEFRGTPQPASSVERVEMQKLATES